MEQEKVYTVIGLMSGTSVDGIDPSLIRTDGMGFVEPLGFMTSPYNKEERSRIKAQLGKSVRDVEVVELEREITLKHVQIINEMIRKYKPESLEVIGFHGQTISHDPDRGHTLQIGDGALLAKEVGIDVVYDFRSEDVRAGGQGAPLIPFYHQALSRYKNLSFPCAFLNIGGVSNVTWIGKETDNILAFDCGAGNALIDDVMSQNFGQLYDHGGGIAKNGQIDDDILQQLMDHPFFVKKPPKSLDRNAWDLSCLESLCPQNKVATLTEFTVQAILKSQEHMPKSPQAWYVCGGGRHNKTMIKNLRKKLVGDLYSIDEIGLNGDALEAEGFGYLAVRSLKNLPLSLPSTTGVKTSQTGGIYKKAV